MNKFMLRKPLALLLSVVMLVSSALVYVPAFATTYPTEMLQGENVLSLFNLSDDQSLVLVGTTFSPSDWCRHWTVNDEVYQEILTTEYLPADATAYNWRIYQDDNNNGTFQKVGSGTLKVNINTAPYSEGTFPVLEGQQNVPFDWKTYAADLESSDGELSLVVDPQASVGAMGSSSGAFEYSHDGSEPDGTEYITFSVSDGVNVAGLTVKIDITEQNDNPVAGDFDVTVNLGVTETVLPLLYVTDEESDATGLYLKSVNVTADPYSGTMVFNENTSDVSLNDNFFTFEPAGILPHTVTLTYVVEDENGGTDSGDITIHVNDPTPSNPVIAHPDYLTVDENNSGTVSYTIDVTDNDEKLDGVSLLEIDYFSPELNAVVVGTLDDSKVKIMPNAFVDGEFVVDYTVVDPDGDTNSSTLTVTITNVFDVNQAPRFIDLEISTAMDVEISFNPLESVTDNENDALSFELIDSTTPHGTLSIDGSDVKYMPNSGWSGIDTFTVKVVETYVVDGDTIINKYDRTIRISVTGNPVNGTPVHVNSPIVISVDEGQAFNLIDWMSYFTDPDSDVLTLVSTSDAANGTPMIVDNYIEYTHDGSDTTTDSFTFIVTDGEFFANGNVSVNVTPVDDADLIALDDMAAMYDTDSDIDIDVLDNDTTGNAGLTVSVTGMLPPENGTLDVLFNNEIKYTPNNGFAGLDVFEYKLTDDLHIGDDAKTALVLVDVRNTNDTPVQLRTIYLNTHEGDFSRIPLIDEINSGRNGEQYVDPSLIDRFDIKWSPYFGLATIDQAGHLHYSANDTFDNEYRRPMYMQYMITMDNGDIFYGCIGIKIYESDMIDLDDDVRTAKENSENNFYLIFDNDTIIKGIRWSGHYQADEQGQPFYGPFHGEVSFTSTGVEYTPEKGYIGIDTFRYFVYDNDKWGDVAQVIISVEPDGEIIPTPLRPYSYLTFANTPVATNVLTQAIKDSLPEYFDRNSLVTTMSYTTAPLGDGETNVNGHLITYDPDTDLSDVVMEYRITDQFGHYGFGTITVVVRNSPVDPYLEIFDDTTQRVNQYYHPELPEDPDAVKAAIESLWSGVMAVAADGYQIDYKYTSILPTSGEYMYNKDYVEDDENKSPISQIFFFGDFDLQYNMKDTSDAPKITDKKKKVIVNGRPILKFSTFDPYDFAIPYGHKDVMMTLGTDTLPPGNVYFGDEIDFFAMLRGFDWEDYRTDGQLTMKEYSEANSTPLIPDGMQLMYYLNDEMTGREFSGIWADLTVGRLLDTDEFDNETFEVPEGAYASGRIEEGPLEGVAYTDYEVQFTLIDSERNVIETPDGYESPRTEMRMIRILNNEPQLTGITPFSAYEVTLPGEASINPLTGVDVIDPEDEAYLGRPKLLEGIVLTIENMSTSTFVSADDMSTTPGKYLLAYTYVDIHGEMDIEHAEVWMVTQPEVSVETPSMTMDLGGNFPTMLGVRANYWPNNVVSSALGMSVIDEQSVMVTTEITASVAGYEDVVPYFTPRETGTYTISYTATMTIQTSPLVSGAVEEGPLVMPEPVILTVTGQGTRVVTVKNPDTDDLKNYMYISDFDPTDYMQVNPEDIYQYDVVMKYKPNAVGDEEKTRLVTSVYHGNMLSGSMDTRDTIDDLAVTSDGTLYSIDVDSVNLYSPMHGEFNNIIDLTLFRNKFSQEGYDEITSVSLTVDADDNLVVVASLLDTVSHAQALQVERYMHVMIVVDPTPEEDKKYVDGQNIYEFELVDLKPIHTSYRMITDIAFDGAFEQLFALGYDYVELVQARDEQAPDSPITDLPGPSGYELMKIAKFVPEEPSSPVGEAMMPVDGDYVTEYVRILLGSYNFHGLATLGDSIFMTRYTGYNYVMRAQTAEDEVMWKTYLDEFNADGQMIGETEMVEDMLRGATGAAAKFDNVLTLTPANSLIAYTGNVTLTLTGLPKIAYDNIVWTPTKGSMSSPIEGAPGVYTAVYTPVKGTPGGTDIVTINVTTDGGNITAKVNVTTPPTIVTPDPVTPDPVTPDPVTPDPTPATVVDVSLDTDAITLDYGETADPAFTSYDFTETVTGTTNRNVTWSLSDDTFVSVDENGVVSTNDNIPVDTGDITVTLTVRTVIGGATATATIIFEEQTPLGAIQFFEPYISGYTDGTFRENSPVTRAEIAIMFAKILKLNKTTYGTQKFTDVSKDHWAYGSIQAMYTTGLFSGYFDDDGLRYFDPEKPIARSEIAQVFTNYWDFLDISVTSENKTVIPDVAPNYWAASAINRIFNTGIFGGFADGTFRPENPTLRGQVVSMINNLIARPANEAATGSFTDILSTSEYYGDIEAASQTFLKPQGE